MISALGITSRGKRDDRSKGLERINVAYRRAARSVLFTVCLKNCILLDTDDSSVIGQPFARVFQTISNGGTVVQAVQTHMQKIVVVIGFDLLIVARFLIGKRLCERSRSAEAVGIMALFAFDAVKLGFQRQNGGRVYGRRASFGERDRAFFVLICRAGLRIKPENVVVADKGAFVAVDIIRDLASVNRSYGNHGETSARNGGRRSRLRSFGSDEIFENTDIALDTEYIDGNRLDDGSALNFDGRGGIVI